MNSENPKLRQQQRNEQQQHFVEASQQVARDFNSVEDLLRYDNSQNPVPPEVAQRVNASIAAEPGRARPWYKAIFGS